MDFLREKYWADQVAHKIQKKLSKIKVKLADLVLVTIVFYMRSLNLSVHNKRLIISWLSQNELQTKVEMRYSNILFIVLAEGTFIFNLTIKNYIF